VTGQENLREVVAAGAKAIRERARISPRFGIVLGTGLGGLSREIEVHARIPYDSIPFFPEPRVASHAGAIVLGMLGGQPVAALEGRYHYYEGYSLAEITLPIRVLRALGVEVLVLSNAAGGLNPNFRIGDIMIISDHLNLMGVNPLVGPNDEALGPRFPDMCEPYDLALAGRLEEIALEAGIRVHRGVYAAMTGPCLETRAEYRFLRQIGVDVVGMSTVPESIVAVHAGLRVVGISCVTDVCLPDALKPVRIEEILRVAQEAEPKMTVLIQRLIERYDKRDGVG
jgi:purine-nucleoside phosphorylase